MSTNIDLRTTFNQDADGYHAGRPRYPDRLFDDLVQKTHLQDSARLLEIGPGTGQATQAIAQRGYQIVAVELGANLAKYAQKVLGDYPNVQVLNTSFEAVDLAPNTFDLVYSATAFHWIEPDVQFQKPHKLLKSGGALGDHSHASCFR
ncbi:MAG: class I SAM-dependent methyltransferase [Anaerolineaceae bacterium]|nr:class I SAM-dependent methyltransferase [Anaerolineaceae bacterium]